MIQESISEKVSRIMQDGEILTYLQLADDHMGAIGYTEHGLRHAVRVAKWSAMILERLGRPVDEVELVRLAGFLHDVGNFICRSNHGQVATSLLYPIFRRFELPDHALGLVLSAIGNHEEQYGQVYNNLCAAVMISDKSDVHRSRVRSYNPSKHDIHDDVNYAVTESKLSLDNAVHEIKLELSIDLGIASVMDYFEIFIERMVMCRDASKFLGCNFLIVVNGSELS